MLQLESSNDTACQFKIKLCSRAIVPEISLEKTLKETQTTGLKNLLELKSFHKVFLNNKL